MTPSIDGTEYDDTLITDDVREIIHGYGGDDDIDSQGGDDVVSGGSGNDGIFVGDGDDKAFGGTGADHITGGNGDDLLDSGGGADILDGSTGIDTLIGGKGDDLLISFFGDDETGHYDALLDGGEGVDELQLNLSHFAAPIAFSLSDPARESHIGDITIRNIESVYLVGGLAADRLTGGALQDYIFGEGSNDQVNGGGGDDYVFGGDGDDIVIGGNGNDVITGNAGADRLYGNAGADHFNYFYASDSGASAATRDVLRDFAVGEDKIELLYLSAPGTALSLEFVDHFTGNAGDIMFSRYGGDFTLVSLDINGDLRADMQINVFDPGAALSSADFVVV